MISKEFNKCQTKDPRRIAKVGKTRVGVEGLESYMKVIYRFSQGLKAKLPLINLWFISNDKLLILKVVNFNFEGKAKWF